MVAGQAVAAAEIAALCDTPGATQAGSQAPHRSAPACVAMRRMQGRKIP
jgi:hypothetical protein